MARPPDQHVVSELSRSVGVTGQVVSGQGYASRLHHLEDDDHFTIIALPQAAREFSLCLPRGLQRAGDRKLRLVLPSSEAGPAMVWSAYLRKDRRPEIWPHEDWTNAEPAELPSRAAVEAALVTHARDRTKLNDDRAAVEAELRKSSQPLHLGPAKGRLLHNLVEWVARHQDLDAAHRQGYRAWQYRGQKVLQLTSAGAGVKVVAGINGEELVVEDRLTPAETADLIDRVEAGIEARRSGQYQKPDEAWLQSFIGRAPHKVGIEGRAFREVPAWRRKGPLDATGTKAWGRGYVDLLGVDAHGVARIIETKLPSNSDAPGLGFQAIDYLAYCCAYRDALCRRLDVSPKATFAIRYVLGQEGPKTPHLHGAAVATMEALEDIEYDVQGLAGWYIEPGKEARGRDVTVTGAPRTWPSRSDRRMGTA
ncbi:MAG: PD-(D/E)XK nuclease family protein [Actinomycetota bacterium]|nr:PD-(D/E)XK nuclease family protein [Actinomycetota bacterium]